MITNPPKTTTMTIMSVAVRGGNGVFTQFDRTSTVLKNTIDVAGLLPGTKETIEFALKPTI